MGTEEVPHDQDTNVAGDPADGRLKEAWGLAAASSEQEEAARLLGVDETLRQLISETLEPVPAAPGRRPENRAYCARRSLVKGKPCKGWT